MYFRGASFLGAAVLLRRRGGYEFVALHLLCQGVEIVLKSALLMIDYDANIGRLASKFRHNLETLAIEAQSVAGLKTLRAPLLSELRNLNSLYSSHLLRYATANDFLIDASSVPYQLVLRRMCAVMRLVDRAIAGSRVDA